MTRYTVTPLTAGWGTQQADRYITGLFEAFEGIADHRTSSRPVPVEFGIEGYFSPMNGISSIGAGSRTATSAL
ncbi:type II toxin-antitoxin system RelE/ParE family toxin [Propionivibrio sp.]|uniref:type II toxin-antitoxin system RelE/ParE family toxin n=1 Tax=Propionivibrio sp. TaxID=2212460 RepID=UPI003BF5F3E9